MQRIITIVIIILVSSSFASGQKTVNKFIDKIKEHQSAVAMTLPGWFIRTGINLSAKGIEDRDEHEIVHLGKKIKKLRFVAVDKAHHITLEESQNFLNKVKEKEGFTEYTRVRNGDTRVYVLVKEEKDKIKYLTIYARGENNVALINLKTDLTLGELDNTNFSWKDKEKLKEEIN